MQAYYEDDRVTLYCGRLEDVLPSLVADGVRADLVLADPPTAETALAWDRWPDGWPGLLADLDVAPAMWCFGSMRMFLERRDEFAAWRLSQDVVWRKARRTTVDADRFARIHEFALHWYRGPWGDVHHVAQKVARIGPSKATAHRSGTPAHIHGVRGASTWEDDGTRYQTTVIDAPSVWRAGAINPTQKPDGILDPLVRYGCPPGGLVLDPFAGSCSTLVAARNLGMRAIGIEMREDQCEQSARRLAQDVLPLEAL